MGTKKNQRKDFQEKTCRCVGGSVNSIEIVVQEEDQVEKADLKKLRKESIISGSRGEFEEALKEGSFYVEMSRLYEAAIAAGKNSRCDQYQAASLSIQTFGNLLAQEGIRSQRINLLGRKISVVEIGELERYFRDLDERRRETDFAVRKSLRTRKNT